MSRLLYIPSVNIFTSIKYGYLYNWWAATNPATVKYGYLYNWYAATDSRNISNTGWHVPTNTEFTTLTTYLGGLSVSGGKLKETGTTYWNSPNTGAENYGNFNLRGSGHRVPYDGVFELISNQSFLWTKSQAFPDFSYYLGVVYSSTSATIGFNNQKSGYSIRLIKDSTTLTHGQTGTYTGNDGKVYQTICIGTQEWLSENLMETKYRNGDAIPEVTDNTAWAALSTGARCSYNNSLSNAGTGSAFASSNDWIVPSNTEWNTLVSYATSSGGGKLKEIGTTYWDSPNTGATNELGFNAKAGGAREYNGNWLELRTYQRWWSTNQLNETNGIIYQVIYNSTYFGTPGSWDKNAGRPLRLVYAGSGTPTSYVGNDGKIYRIVQIGTQWWLADNLAETKYRDGSTIPVVTDNTAWAALTTGARCVYNNDESNM